MTAVTAQAYFHQGSRQLAHGQVSEAACSFQRAIDAGHAESHAALSYMHYGTYRGIQRSDSKVFQLASAGARMGCIHSKGALAVCQRGGIGTAKNVEEAFRLASESANAGIGVSHDNAMAAHLILLAASRARCTRTTGWATCTARELLL